MNFWTRILLIVIVFAHGAGHILFLVPMFGGANWGQASGSWLLTGLLGERLTRGLGILVWITVIIGYLAADYGFYTRTDWWPQLMIGASGVSALGLLVFWAGTSPVISALTVDLLIILALQVFKWPVLTQA